MYYSWVQIFIVFLLQSSPVHSLMRLFFSDVPLHFWSCSVAEDANISEIKAIEKWRCTTVYMHHAARATCSLVRKKLVALWGTFFQCVGFRFAEMLTWKRIYTSACTTATFLASETWAKVRIMENGPISLNWCSMFLGMILKPMQVTSVYLLADDIVSLGWAVSCLLIFQLARRCEFQGKEFLGENYLALKRQLG